MRSASCTPNSPRSRCRQGRCSSITARTGLSGAALASSMLLGNGRVPLTLRDARTACPPGPARMRCLLVDDNAACLERERALLARQGVTVVGTAASTADALRQATALRPDVAVVDIGLGDESGFDLAVHLSEADVAVIMVSAAPAADYAD